MKFCARKRSQIWKFFEELGPNSSRCKLCYRKMSRNMARHLRLKHPKIYKHIQLKRREKSSPPPPGFGLSGNWVKKYCVKIGDRKYQCTVCENVLRMPNGLLGNMKRHIRSKHPYVFHEEIKLMKPEDDVNDDSEVSEYVVEEILEDENEYKTRKSVAEDSESESDTERATEENEEAGEITLSETDPKLEEKVKYLCAKPVLGKKRAKNCFWNFFDVVEENHVYSCLACSKHVSIFPHSIANLKRHIKLKHRKQHQFMLKYMPDSKTQPVSFDKYYFDIEGDDQYKCKACGDILTCQEDDQQHLFDHIQENHPDQILTYQEEQSEDDLNDYDVVVVKDIQSD